MFPVSAVLIAATLIGVHRPDRCLEFTLELCARFRSPATAGLAVGLSTCRVRYSRRPPSSRLVLLLPVKLNPQYNVASALRLRVPCRLRRGHLGNVHPLAVR